MPGGGFGPGFGFAGREPRGTRASRDTSLAGREPHRQLTERARIAGRRSHMRAHARERLPESERSLEDKTVKQNLVARRPKLGQAGDPQMRRPGPRSPG